MKKTRKLISVMTSMALFTCAAVVPMSTDAAIVSDNVREEIESGAEKIFVNLKYRYENNTIARVTWEAYKQSEIYADERMAEYRATHEVYAYNNELRQQLNKIRSDYRSEGEEKYFKEFLEKERREQTQRILESVGIDIEDIEITNIGISYGSLFCYMTPEQIAKAEASKDITIVAVEKDLDRNGNFIRTPDKTGTYTYRIGYKYAGEEVLAEADRQLDLYVKNELDGMDISDSEKAKLANNYLSEVRTELLRKEYEEKSAYILETCGIDKENAVINPYSANIRCRLNYEELQRIRNCDIVYSIQYISDNELGELTTTTTCGTTQTQNTTTTATTATSSQEDFGTYVFVDTIEFINDSMVTFKEHGTYYMSITHADQNRQKLLSYQAGSEVLVGFEYIRANANHVSILNINTVSLSKLDLGDPTGDSKIDARDASFVLAEYSMLSTGGVSTLTTVEKTAADANKDGQIDSKDASLMLSMYAHNATSEEKIDSMENYIESFVCLD